MGLNNKNNTKAYLIAIIAGLVIFSATAVIIVSGNEAGFDDGIRFWVYEHRNPVLDRFFITVTYMGNWQFMVLIGICLLVFSKTRKTAGIPFAVTSLTSTLIYKLIKSTFQRPRPDLMYRIIEQGGFSFPSGHSMNCMVCYGILIYLIRRNVKDKKAANLLTGICAGLIVLIGISRVYVGVHFPTDIIGGWSLGISVLAAAILIQEKRRNL